MKISSEDLHRSQDTLKQDSEISSSRVAMETIA